MKRILTGLTGLVLALQLLSPTAAQAQYTVERPRPPLRGHLWVGEGGTYTISSNSSFGHRFRVGAEGHFGSENQFIFGWTFYDRLFSGERSTSSGDISRGATDLNFGYFLVPDRLFAEYTLHIEAESGSSAIGDVTTLGHQASVGYRFYTNGAFNLAAEAAYLYVAPYVASTYDYNSQITSSVKFPAAHIWSLNLRIGFDFVE